MAQRQYSYGDKKQRTSDTYITKMKMGGKGKFDLNIKWAQVKSRLSS